MNKMRNFNKTNLAASLLVLLAVSSSAAWAQAPATQTRQGDKAWPTESAAAVSATVSFVDPMAAVDGASSGKIRKAPAYAPSTLSFVDTNATVDGSSPHDRTISVGTPSTPIAENEAVATVGGEQ
jgi:hypothetical protein